MASNKDLEKTLGKHMREIYRRPLPLPPEPERDLSQCIYIANRTKDDEPVYLTMEQLDTHLHVVGGSGKGKSFALRQLFRELVKRKKEHGEGFSVVDTHGTLAKYVRDLCAEQIALQAEDVVYMDLEQAGKVVSMNPLRDTGQEPYFIASCMTEALMKARGAGRSLDQPTIKTVLEYLGQVLIYHGLTLADFRYFLRQGDQEKAVRRMYLERMPKGNEVRSFWEDFDKKNPATADPYTQGPANRLDALVQSTPLRRILGQTGPSLDFRALMDNGGIAIFCLSREGSSVTVDGQHQLAALIVQQYRQVLESRQPDKARPHTLVLDEFGDYTSADFARMLTTARKFRLRCVFSHQNLTQMILKDQDRTLFDAVLAIPNKLIFGGLPVDQAQLLALQVYLALLNPDKVKHQPVTVTWDPIPTKVTLRSSSGGGSTTETGGGGKTAGTSSGTSSSTTADRNRDGAVSTDGSSAGENSAETTSWSFASQHTWTESEQEAWTTFYKRRDQFGTPVFETLDEQVFRYTQELNTNPQSVCTVATADGRPERCQIPHINDPAINDKERAKFLEMVYDKPYCRQPAEVDEDFELRKQKLLEEAPPGPRVVRRGPGPKKSQ